MGDLTKNFSLSEFTKSATASRLGLDNTPTSKIKTGLLELCTNILQPVSDALNAKTPKGQKGIGIIVTSGYRAPAVNTAVGGSKTSAHRYGYAADIHCPLYEGGSVKKLCIFIEDYLKKNKVAFDQLIYEFGNDNVPTAGWVHIGVRSSSGLQRGQLLIINSNGTKQVKTFK